MKNLKPVSPTTATLVNSKKTAPPAPKAQKGTLKTVPIKDIIVESWHRQDVGDIKGMAASFAEQGVIERPVVDQEMRLISGYRRLQAAHPVGWKEIAVVVLDIEDALLAKAAADSVRKDLTPAEKFSLKRVLAEKAEDPDWRERFMKTGGDAKRLDEQIGQRVNLSRESIRKVGVIEAAFEQDPERYGPILEALKKDGRIDRHYRTVARLQARGDDEPVKAIILGSSLQDDVDDATDHSVLAYYRETNFAARADMGCVLMISASPAFLSAAAALMRVAGFTWLHTLSGGNGELWLVGALGKKTQVDPQALDLLAEGCQQSLQTLAEAAEIAFDGPAYVAAAATNEEVRK